MPRRKGKAIEAVGPVLSGVAQFLMLIEEAKEQKRRRKLEEKGQAFTEEQRNAWRDTRKRSQAEIAQRQQAEAFIRILSGGSPFGRTVSAEIPDVNIKKQRAYDITGGTAPVDVKLGAFGEGLTRAGYTPEQVAMAKLKELGILPKEPSPTEQRNVMANEALLRLPQDERDEVLLGTRPGRPALSERDRSRYLELWEGNQQTPLKGKKMLEFTILRNKFEPTSDLDKKLNQWEKLLSKPQANWTATDRLRFGGLRNDLFRRERTVDPAIIRRRVIDMVKSKYDLQWAATEKQMQEVEKVGKHYYRDQWPELDVDSAIYGEDPLFETYQDAYNYVVGRGHIEHAEILWDPRLQQTPFRPIKLSELIGGRGQPAIGGQPALSPEDEDLLK